MMNLSPDIISQTIDLIIAYKPVERIILFGSRASDRYKETSDIDLAIDANEWTEYDIGEVKDRLENKIQTPLRFDLVSLNLISKESFKNNIINEGKTLYDAKTN
jgi:predicted nucleotidyltransferase